MAKRVSAAFREAFPHGRLIVVSNRQPYVHVRDEAGGLSVESPAGGLSLALDPVLQAVGGVWIAWGHGDADPIVVDERDHVRVPPDDPSYDLRRLWLTDAENEDYYLGFSNQSLWPLCHNILQHVRFRTRYWRAYRRVNLRFARAAAEELGDGDGLVWFHDYHLALAPLYFRRLRRDAAAAFFWHIPWPAWETFRVCPWKLDILEGLLGNDLLGFHLDSFANNFLDACERELGAFVDRKKQRVVHRGHITHVDAFPISIDVAHFESMAAAEEARGTIDRIRDELGLHGKRVGIGVDRLDYTKGIVERIEALRLLFQNHPELIGNFTFVQIAVPSRSEIPAYQTLEDELDGRIQALNQALATDSWKPVITIKDSLPQNELAAYYRLADLVVVSSIQDGMNLVVKEYVASQGLERPGAVCLSEFAGASEELEHTLPVNPFYTQGFAEDLKRALDMPLEERRARMAAMKSDLARHTIFDWMVQFLNAAKGAEEDNLEHRPAAVATP